MKNIYLGDAKLPRKIKKEFLGRRVKKQHLKKLLSSVKITQNKYPGEPKIEPYEFCPACGCRSSYLVYHGAQDQEVYETAYCLRCHKEVGGADNSRFYHVLEDMFQEQNN
ncbi:hypothetical protein C4588_06190 [Candidatus Parcubacteria bacterium]|nr:MAG: hypothetical protein C4588_06190 [Candidatus Parcubacteria bacterium]